MDSNDLTALRTAALAVLAFVNLWVVVCVTRKQSADTRQAVDKTIAAQHEIALKDISVRFYLDMKERWDSDAMLQKRKALAYLFISEPKPRTDHFFHKLKEDVPNFFEDLSSLLEERYIDERLTYELLSYYAKGWYSVCKPYIDWLQAKKKDDTLFAGFKILVDRLMVLEAADRVTTPTSLTDSEVKGS